MSARIIAAGPWPANIIVSQLLVRQIAKPRRRWSKPGAAARVATQVRVQAIAVVNHDAPVARQMHIQFSAIRTEHNRVGERGQRVLRRKGGAAAMGKDERWHCDRTPAERHGPSWNGIAAIVTSAPQLAERPSPEDS
jgi:hypothetical protein